MTKQVKKIGRNDLHPATKEYEEEFKKKYETFLTKGLLPKVFKELEIKIKNNNNGTGKS